MLKINTLLKKQKQWPLQKHWHPIRIHLTRVFKVAKLVCGCYSYRYSSIYSYHSWCAQALNQCTIWILNDDNITENFCVLLKLVEQLQVFYSLIEWGKTDQILDNLNTFRSVLVVLQLFLNFHAACFCVIAWHECISTAHFLSCCWLIMWVGMLKWLSCRLIHGSKQSLIGLISCLLQRVSYLNICSVSHNNQSFLHRRGLDLILLRSLKFHVVLQPFHSMWKP